jgi:hypothetical protein
MRQGMSKNPKATAMWIANVAVPGGAKDIVLDEHEAARYNVDPDSYVGDLYGLSKFEYLQWIDFDGAPLCGHRTKGDDLCRNLVGPIQLPADRWKARHRKSRFTKHG